MADSRLSVPLGQPIDEVLGDGPAHERAASSPFPPASPDATAVHPPSSTTAIHDRPLPATPTKTQAISGSSAPVSSTLAAPSTAPAPATPGKEQQVVAAAAPPQPAVTSGSAPSPVPSSANTSPDLSTSTRSTPLVHASGTGPAFIVEPIPVQERSDAPRLPGASSTTSVVLNRPNAPSPAAAGTRGREPSAFVTESHPPSPPAEVEIPPTVPESQQHQTAATATRDSRNGAIIDTDPAPPYKQDIPRVNPSVVEPVSRAERSHEVEKIKADHRELTGQEPKGTVVPGLEDDKLFALLRRFDKNITHTLTPPHGLPTGEPDLRRSPLPTVPFNSQAVRTNLERCYATGGIAGIRFFREMQRLMSWEECERKRTTYFCVAYFTAWIFHLTTPLFLGLLLVLVLVPRSRAILFPVIPPPPGQAPSATDPTNQKGDESLVDVKHPQKHRSKAEQIEEQSWEFTKSVEKFGVRVLLGGRHKPSSTQLKLANGGDDTEEEEEGVVDTQAKRVKEAKAKTLQKTGSIEEANKEEAKKAKEHRDAMVGLYAKALQDGLSDFADFVERTTNCMTPPQNYPRHHGREKIAYCVLLPILIITAITPTRYFAHGITFLMGFAFFGQPLIIRAAQTFVRWVPDWQDKLDLRNSLYSGVPTDAQLTLYLLRQRELASQPLPRPPAAPTAAEAEAHLNDTSPMAEAHDESTIESVGDGDGTHLVGDGQHADAGASSNKVKSKVVALGQKIASKGATFHNKGKIEVLPAQLNGGKAPKRSMKARLSNFILNRATLDDKGSIWAYPASLNGNVGHIIIDNDEGDPITESQIAFLPKGASEPSREFSISDIVEMKKGGVGLPRSVLGWAAGLELGGTGLELRIKRGGVLTEGKEVAPNVWVTNVRFEEDSEDDEVDAGTRGNKKKTGEVVQFERIGRRDQLFVRLLSISPNLWETFH